MFRCCLGMNKFSDSRTGYRPKIEGLTQAYKIAGKTSLELQGWGALDLDEPLIQMEMIQVEWQMHSTGSEGDQWLFTILECTPLVGDLREDLKFLRLYVKTNVIGKTCKTNTIKMIQKASSIDMSQNAHQVWCKNTCSLCSSCLLSFWTFSLLWSLPTLESVLVNSLILLGTIHVCLMLCS